MSIEEGNVRMFIEGRNVRLPKRCLEKIMIFSCVLFGLCASGGTGEAIAQMQFQRIIGGTDNDLARPIIYTTDSGYALAGYTFSFGAGLNDIYILKLDASATLQWTRTVGGTSIDEAYSIIQTADGGYAVASTTLSFGAGQNDMYVLKLDRSGTYKWSRTIGGSMAERALSIAQSTDGGLAVAGSTASFGAGSGDIYIVKLDSSGMLQWNTTIGAANADIPLSIIQTTDGGYALGGYTFSFGAGQNDVYIVKLDSGGALQWSKTVGGTNYDYGQSIIQSADGGYVVAGYTQSFGAGNYDVYVVKLDSAGALQWSRTVGGPDVDYAYSIVQTADGGYVAAGSTRSFGAGNGDMYIVKLDSGGTLQWSKTVGGTGIDEARSIIQTADGGYVTAGTAYSFGTGNSDVFIVKLDASGNTCGNSTSPTSTVTTPTPTVGTASPTVTTPTSTVTTPSPTIGSGGAVTSICTTVGVEPGLNEPPDRFALHQNHPNPFNSSTRIRFEVGGSGLVSLKVYNILGQEVATLVSGVLRPGRYEVRWDALNMPSGVYFYTLTSSRASQTRKLMIMK